MDVKCAAACTNPTGARDFYCVIVRCTRQQYDQGAHLAAARDKAEENGYSVSLVYDEKDLADTVIYAIYDWDTAEVVSLYSLACPYCGSTLVDFDVSEESGTEGRFRYIGERKWRKLIENNCLNCRKSHWISDYI